MQRLFLKKVLISVLFLTVIVIFSFLLFKDYEVVKPINWSSSVNLRSNAFAGRLRVVDSTSGATLFFYSVDPEIHPVSIDKKDDDTWTVTFKKRDAIQKDKIQ